VVIFCFQDGYDIKKRIQRRLLANRSDGLQF
jgi:hypothetical protein